MAKVKSSGLRNYVGRLAGNVYYINKGQNIARELAPQVSNPQTESQMDQRIKLSNVVAMYRLNADWMKDHAFPNRPQNQSIYNAFVAANLAGSEVALTKEDAARGYCVVAPYEITKGSLPRVQMLETEDPTYAPSTLKSSLDSFDGKTIGELSLDLIEQNPFLQDGDQLSIVINFQYNDAAGIRAICRAYELTLDTTSEEQYTSHAINDILYPEASTVGEGYNVSVAIDDPAEYAGSVYAGVAVIISRKTSSGIQVSPATLALYGDDRFYATMTSETRKRLARNSYGVSTEPFLVPGGGEGGDTPEPQVVTITTVNSVQSGGELTLGNQGVFSVHFGESHTAGAACVVTITPKEGVAVTVNSTVSNFGDTCTGQDATLADKAIASVSVTISGSEPATITFA